MRVFHSRNPLTLVAILCLSACIAACAGYVSVGGGGGDDELPAHPADSPDIDPEFRTLLEAEDIALCLTQELFPPEELTEQLFTDLAVARETFDIEAIQNTYFTPPWDYVIEIVTTPIVREQILAGTYIDWDILNEDVGITEIFETPTGFELAFEGGVNPCVAAPMYQELWGIRAASPRMWELEQESRMYVVNDEFLGIAYLFRDGGDFYYVVFDEGEPRLEAQWDDRGNAPPAWWHYRKEGLVACSCSARRIMVDPKSR